jgi:hypothetical protein
MAVLRRSICRSRVTALALIVLTFLGTTGSWHVDSDDPDCTVPIAHNHSAHHERLARAAAPAPVAHCAICHWLQSFRIDGARQARDYQAPAGQTVGSSAPSVAVYSADRLNLPARAPPSPSFA